MQAKERRRPDEEAMRRILSDNRGSIVEIILRLAWKLALRRDEMHRLVWRDIDFSARELALPGRQTPIDDETCEVLWERFAARHLRSEFVVTADRGYTQMSPSSISRAARQALDAGGQTEIHLEDLRQDCILRWIETWGVSCTARFSGMAVDTLYANYSRPRWKDAAVKKRPAVDEFALWQVIWAEGASPVGLILRLTWRLGLSVAEALDLTWEQVDLQGRKMDLPDRQVPFGAGFGQMLSGVRAERAADGDPHVILTPNAQTPYDAPRISKLVKTALIRGGMEHVTLESLIRHRRQREGELRLLRQAEASGYLTRNEAMELLPATAAQAYAFLRRLSEDGKLVKVGARYYPAGTVVPPEDHARTIDAYLAENGGAYRQELADILHLEPRQCSGILRKLTAEGRLVKDGQRYLLP